METRDFGTGIIVCVYVDCPKSGRNRMRSVLPAVLRPVEGITSGSVLPRSDCE